jgi:hypothetical protein
MSLKGKIKVVTSSDEKKFEEEVNTLLNDGLNPCFSGNWSLTKHFIKWKKL